MHQIRIIAFICVLGTLLISGCVSHYEPTTTAASIPAQPQSGGLSCEISSLQAAYTVGDVPKVSVVIRNDSDRPVVLVGSLDGSEERWRYPLVYFELTGPEGENAFGPYGRCGNMDGIRVEDFVKVQPGETFDPYSSGFFGPIALSRALFDRAGTYRLSFTYSTLAPELADWWGRPAISQVDEDIASLVERVLPVELKCHIDLEVGE
jgi:hypothetical protein